MNRSTTSYVPEDGGITVQSLEFLHGPPGKALRETVTELLATHRSPGVAEVARLRKQLGAEHVGAALKLGELQIKAAEAGKFRGLAYVWGTPEGLEQATDSAVAEYKAGRFVALSPGVIVDLCAGIGGDALALAKVARVTAVDLSEVRGACLRMNAETAGLGGRITVVAEDISAVLESLPREALFHLDPARRSGGKRSSQYEDLIPGPEMIERVMKHFAGGGIKLSSAVDFESLPGGHVELISRKGVVVQAMLWVGAMAKGFAPGTRTATIVGGTPAETFSYTAKPEGAHVVLDVSAQQAALERGARLSLYEVDGALTRAGIAGAFAEGMGLEPVTVDGGYAISRPGAELLLSRALTAFALEGIVPFSEKRVAAALREFPAGKESPVEVKTRGRLPGVETDRLQRIWSKAAPCGRTVLVFRFGDDVFAAIARR